MSVKKFELICQNIASISPFIRFVGVIGVRGELLAHTRRQDLTPLLDEKKYKISILTYCNENRPRGIF